jgi:hypothetical protein
MENRQFSDISVSTKISPRVGAEILAIKTTFQRKKIKDHKRQKYNYTFADFML